MKLDDKNSIKEKLNINKENIYRNYNRNKNNNKNPKHSYLEVTNDLFSLQNNQDNNFKRIKIPIEIRANSNSIRENSLIRNGINSISSKIPINNYINNRSYINININSNGKYYENYIQSLSDLRENLEGQNKTDKILNDSIKYYNIPRLNKNTENIRLNEIHNRIEKSIKYNKSDSSTGNIDDMINKENDRLNIYLNNLNFLDFKNLEKNKDKDKENKIDSENYMKAKHPNLIDLQNMGKMRYSKLKIPGNKFMGKRYDSN